MEMNYEVKEEQNVSTKEEIGFYDVTGFETSKVPYEGSESIPMAPNSFIIQ
jgi:hypothetical protein